MASILIRNLDEHTLSRLRLRAKRHKRSMEGEARHILRSSLGDDTRQSVSLAQSISSRFKSLGGVDLELPSRLPMRDPPMPRR